MMNIFRAVLSIIVVSCCLSLSHAASEMPISCNNYHDGETIRYTVPLIRGVLADKTLTSVEVINQSSQRDSAHTTGLAYDGHFKAVTELVPGLNKLLIKAGPNTMPLSITYVPQTNPYKVRMVYALAKDGNTNYQTPIANDAQDYAAKLSTLMLMMQTFTAERMNDIGMGRRTFNLELDENGTVKIHVITCDIAAQEAYNHPGGRDWLFGYMSDQAQKLLPKELARDVMYVGFSRFNPITKANEAYTALGGGSTAVFGSTNMYCYPSHIRDIQKAFMDTTVIDTNNFSSDSADRDTFWACASTSIGATLHELGHTMDLPHCTDPTGIMSRGFDGFNRFWTVREPPAKNGKTFVSFTEDRGAKWELSSAAFLRPSTWLSMDARDYTTESKITVRVGSSTDEFVIESPDGIAAVVMGYPGMVSSAVPMDWSQPAPTSLTINVKDYPQDLGNKKAYLRIMDGQAHVVTAQIRDIRRQKLVQ